MDLSDDDNVDALSLPRSNPDKAQSWQSEHFNKLYVWCGQIDQIRVVRYDVLSGSKLSLLVSMQVGAICPQIAYHSKLGVSSLSGDSKNAHHPADF